MDLSKYDLKADKSLMIFRFISIGPKGQIPKLIKYTETRYKGMFNLGFGDLDIQTGKIDDMTVSDNGDTDKVLATVVETVYVFMDKYPDYSVFATGSTRARTRLYRLGISKYIHQIEADFELYGFREEKWTPFEKGVDYEAFLVQRKKR